ncbi:putative pectinesterase [Helianthus debilis subsp. tardiflorus]
MLVGDGMNSTIITGSRNFVDGYTIFTSATLCKYLFAQFGNLYKNCMQPYVCISKCFVKNAAVIGNNFLARDLTIINTSGLEKHQVVALRVTSDAAFYHCQFISHQDTIHGTVDFIFGNATVIFERCLILVRKPIPGQRNVITAQRRLDPNQNTGISLQNTDLLDSDRSRTCNARCGLLFAGKHLCGHRRKNWRWFWPEMMVEGEVG